ncbi:hypothetical protein ACFSMW_14520 [Virgibacillus halophilus]|uniref:hypothetical protein n=1 Tax=Tigheibacillus halophilus TaxID=361280 RepID=UPI0036313554
MKNRKSPITALLWSFVMSGFGQLYNRDYVIGFALLVFEVLLNLKSNLNLALKYTFQGHFLLAHQVTNFEWGLFYPSLWAFSMWQAYHHAKEINTDQGSSANIGLTGMFLGMVVGMNVGLIIGTNKMRLFHMDNNVFASPVINGLFFGMIGALTGTFIQKKMEKKKQSYDC